MTNNSIDISADDSELLRHALTEIIGLVNRAALKLVVVETALQELVSTTEEPRRAHFADLFRTRVADLLQTHADRLLPDDDAEITLTVANMLRAADRANRLAG